jgi:hypothetical protein
MDPVITDVPTPCFGNSRLFDSTFEADHVIARELCLGCPMRTECIAERTKTIELLGIMSLEGTWAGNLYTGKKVRERAQCGTRSGYNGHRYRDEKACDACKKAEAKAAREAKAAKLAAAVQDEEPAA